MGDITIVGVVDLYTNLLHVTGGHHCVLIPSPQPPQPPSHRHLRLFLRLPEGEGWHPCGEVILQVQHDHGQYERYPEVLYNTI